MKHKPEVAVRTFLRRKRTWTILWTIIISSTLLFVYRLQAGYSATSGSSPHKIISGRRRRRREKEKKHQLIHDFLSSCRSWTKCRRFFIEPIQIFYHLSGSPAAIIEGGGGGGGGGGGSNILLISSAPMGRTEKVVETNPHQNSIPRLLRPTSKLYDQNLGPQVGWVTFHTTQIFY